MSIGRHERALNAAVRSAGKKLGPESRPVVELCRVLARQMDAAPASGPGTRLVGTYLTCLRTLNGLVTADHARASAGATRIDELRAKRAKAGQ